MPTNNFKVGEMLNRRTPNSKTWMNFDGSFTTEIHSGIVHYQDENGNLQNINTDLYDEADFDQIDFPVAKDGDSLFYEAQARAVSDKKKNRLDRDKFDFQGLKVPFDCKIPRNIKRGYSIGKGKSNLSFIPVGASSSKGYVEGNKITYPDVWPDTDVVLEMLPTGVKETIILKTNKAPFYFSFEVQGNLDGEMKIEPPWLQDAEGTKRDVVQGVSELEGKILLNLAADVSGLVYPIEIDPTVNTTATTEWVDTVADRENPTYSYQNSTIIFIGESNRYSAFIRPVLPSIPMGSVVTNAKLSLYLEYSTGTLPSTWGLEVKTIRSDWAETITYNTKPISNNPRNLSIYMQQYTYTDVDVTYEMNEMAKGTGYGVELNYNNLNVRYNFSSSDTTSTYYPKLSITYNLPPTAPTVTAPNGGETWNSLHTVTWGAASDPSDPAGSIQTSTGATNLGSSSYVGQTFTVDKDAYISKLKYYYWGSTFPSGARLELRGVDPTTLVPNNTIYASIVDPIKGSDDYLDFPLQQYIKLPLGTRLALIAVNPSPGTSPYVQIFGTTTSNYANGEQIVSTDGKSWQRNVGQDANVKIEYDGSSGQANLKYQIQLSTNNGSSWKDIVSLTNAGVTSYQYDFINEPETSLAKIRIRAYDGSAYGPWDESDGVFTIVHNLAPTAPTNLSPTSGTIDRATVNRLSWQHNDANADPQAKFDLQWRVQGSTTWNEVTQSTVNQYYDAPANLFPRGTIEWRVRTYDQADLSSPYSNIATFFAGDKPAMPTIVLPGPTVAVANPTVQWSSTDQTGFLLTVKDTTGTTVFSRERHSTNKAETITYSLENQQDYTIELKIKNADELYSDAAVLNISVSYTPPAIPDIETLKGDSFVQIKITDPIPTGTQPAVLYHEIYKEIENEFVLLATNVQNEYKDYNVASGENIRYFVRTIGDNETFSDTTTFSESISLTGVWLHVVEDPEDTIHEFKADGGGRSSKWGLENAVHHFQGRKRPVIETGEMEDFTVDFSLKISKPPYASTPLNTPLV